MSALHDAIEVGDCATVKRLVAEGADVADRNVLGQTALLKAAFHGHIPMMDWLLTEGGSCFAEKTGGGDRALSLAALNGQYTAMQYLLEEHGASMSEINYFGRTVWDEMHLRRDERATELSSLLKVIVMLQDAPAAFITKLSPQHADICTRGRQFRAQLPSYLEQQ
jgi:ankyrin repeat protein